MKKKAKLILLLSAVLTLASCNLMTREDLKKQDDERQLREQLSTIQRGKADNELHYQDLQNDLRVVAGRVDTLDHNQSVEQQSRQRDLESLKKLIDTQNEKIRLLEQHLEATETRLTAAIQALSTAPAAAAQESGGGAGHEASSKKGENPLFSDAEALFTKKEYKKAIVKYQAYRDKNPKGPHQAEATYKIGVCFQELGLKTDAKDFFQETIQNHAGSTSAKKAKLRLSRLK